MHPDTGVALWSRNHSSPVAVVWSMQPGSDIGQRGMLRQEVDLVEDMLVFCGQPSQQKKYTCQGIAVNPKHRHLLPLMDMSTQVPEAPEGKRRMFVGSTSSYDPNNSEEKSEEGVWEGGLEDSRSLFGISDPHIRYACQATTLDASPNF